jgi:predicted metal-dependent hydrolase
VFSKLFSSKKSGLAKSTAMDVCGLQIELVRKAVKHLRLQVSPPSGQVRVSAPTWVSDDTVRLAVTERLQWIKQQQARIAALPVSPAQLLHSGEQYYFQGQVYRLQIIAADVRQQYVELADSHEIKMYVHSNSTVSQRAALLHDWYRDHMKQEIPRLINKWEAVMGVQVADWGVKRMRTRWGSCNIRVRRIWLNLELAKHSPQCLEYVVVHEMVHLFERYHNERFKRLMDQFLPQWRSLKTELNRGASLLNAQAL